MKRYCLTATLLVAGIVVLANCGSRTNAKVEQPNTLNNSAPISSEAKAAPQERKVLWDFRKPEANEPPKLSNAETRSVDTYLFGGVRPVQITSRMSGSFTRPGAKETLYYLSGCLHDGQFTNDCEDFELGTDGWLAVFDGSTPVVKIHEDLGQYIAAVPDVNGDEVNEILSFGGDRGSGVPASAGVNLGQISGKKFKGIKGFNGYWDNCAIGGVDVAKNAAAAVITYVPSTDGKMPVFTESYFQGVCGDDRPSDDPKWKKITQKEFNAFFNGNS